MSTRQKKFGRTKMLNLDISCVRRTELHKVIEFQTEDAVCLFNLFPSHLTNTFVINIEFCNKHKVCFKQMFLKINKSKVFFQARLYKKLPRYIPL